MPTSPAPTIDRTVKPPARKRRPSRFGLDGAGVAEPRATEVTTYDSGMARDRPASERPSALDAAAWLLGGLTGDEAKVGLTSRELIERMAKQKLWTSPDGKTPHATLYAAIVREITAKGPTARFRKVSRGHFAAVTGGASASKSPARQAAPAPRKRAQP
jgi:hypothetical protein